MCSCRVVWVCLWWSVSKLCGGTRLDALHKSPHLVDTQQAGYLKDLCLTIKISLCISTSLISFLWQVNDWLDTDFHMSVSEMSNSTILTTHVNLTCFGYIQLRFSCQCLMLCILSLDCFNKNLASFKSVTVRAVIGWIVNHSNDPLAASCLSGKYRVCDIRTSHCWTDDKLKQREQHCMSCQFYVLGNLQQQVGILSLRG